MHQAAAWRGIVEIIDTTELPLMQLRAAEKGYPAVDTDYSLVLDELFIMHGYRTTVRQAVHDIMHFYIMSMNDRIRHCRRIVDYAFQRACASDHANEFEALIIRSKMEDTRQLLRRIINPHHKQTRREKHEFFRAFGGLPAHVRTMLIEESGTTPLSASVPPQS